MYAEIRGMGLYWQVAGFESLQDRMKHRNSRQEVGFRA